MRVVLSALAICCLLAFPIVAGAILDTDFAEVSANAPAATPEPAIRPAAPPAATIVATPLGSVTLLSTTGSTGRLHWRTVPPEALAACPRLPLFRGLDQAGRPIIDEALIVGDTSAAFLLIAVGDESAIDVAFYQANAPEPLPEPTPDPTPAPPPAGPRWLVIIEESADRTASQAATLASPKLRAYLTENGHRLRIYDRDVVPAGCAKYRDLAGDDLPACFVVDDEGQVLHRGPLPAAADALVELLKTHGG